MSTGDLFNNIEKLRTELRVVKFNDLLDIEGLSKGHFATYKPILIYVLFKYSKLVANCFNDLIGELDSRKDLKFLEGIYKFLRITFVYRPVLTSMQFT
jgi:hypothetical protein